MGRLHLAGLFPAALLGHNQAQLCFNLLAHFPALLADEVVGNRISIVVYPVYHQMCVGVFLIEVLHQHPLRVF